MTEDNYLDIMHEALRSEFGMVMRIGDPYEAEQLRTKFYRVRNKQRQKGDKSFDALSFALPPNGDLQILCRERLPRKEDDGHHHETERLRFEELPDRFGYCNTSFKVRGKQKPLRGLDRAMRILGKRRME